MKYGKLALAVASAFMVLSLHTTARADFCDAGDGCAIDCPGLCFAQVIPPDGCNTACAPDDDGLRSSGAKKKRISISAKRLTRDEILKLINGKLPPGFSKGR